MPWSVEVHIESLMLEGLDELDREAIGRAVGTEVARRLQKEPALAAMTSGMDVGPRVADAVHRALDPTAPVPESPHGA